MFDYNETLEQARARNIRDALMEDIGRQDWTARLVPTGQRVRARVLVREDAVLCGRDWFDGCIQATDPNATVDWHVAEGTRMTAETLVCHIEADARALLTAERPR
jgi:nicotinate-nucleotide pyrophosphorylase (carboxylating)